MLERYSYEYQRGVGPPTWVVDMFLDLGVSEDVLVFTLESMYYGDEAPFKGRHRRPLVVDLLAVTKRWFHSSSLMGMRGLFGGEENALAVSNLLRELAETGLDRELREECEALRGRIESSFR